MITFLQYIQEQISDNLTPTDICDFYYLSYAFQIRGNSLSKEENFILNDRLYELKNKYLNNIGGLIVAQLNKYKTRRRHDPGLEIPDASEFELLHKNMQMTYRSDMSRRNDKWEYITDNLKKLESANQIKDIIFFIDRINNAVHNSATGLLEKIDPYLLNILDKVHNAQTPKDFLQYVSRNIKNNIQLFSI